MWHFRIFGIPVAVQPYFWLIALFLGQGHWDPSNWLVELALWMLIVFVGVLTHELGHALAGRAFGLTPVITLHGMGGLTAWVGAQRISALRRMAIAFAGPAVGLSIGVAVYGIRALMHLPPDAMESRLLGSVIWVNFGWGIVNLIPMLPLDGGNMMASGLELLLPKRLPLSRILAHGASLLVAGLLALLVARQSLWNAVLVALFAYANIRALWVLWPARHDRINA